MFKPSRNDWKVSLFTCTFNMYTYIYKKKSIELIFLFFAFIILNKWFTPTMDIRKNWKRKKEEEEESLTV